MENSKFIKENKKMGKYIFVIIMCLIFSIIYLRPHITTKAEKQPERLWQVQSIDTMKTSRDMARAELHNADFDIKIDQELQSIKKTGANYVALGTPYDEEFIPYLKRWIKIAREKDLHIWFRGNWSEWEGWFEYPKDLTPEDHIQKTSAFIQKYPELFEDEDIFEGCPECENAQHWKQPERNNEYNEYLIKQRASNKAAFEKINKNVHSNIVSIIGGRAKEVLDQETITAHDNVVSIDHYVKSPSVMRDYINFFRDTYHAKLVISEFGAPIPDINGEMTEQEQADFIESVFEEFYKGKDTVIGVNYFVSTIGTTPIINDDYTPKKAYDVVKKYFTPGIVTGKVTNQLGDPQENITIKTDDGVINTQTDKDGTYTFAIPPRSVAVTADGGANSTQTHTVTIESSGSKVIRNFEIEPTNPDSIYKTKLFFHNLFGGK